MDVDAIIGAVRGVLTGTVGSVRTVPSGTFTELVTGDTSDPETWMRARHGASGALQAMADVEIGAPSPTGWIGPPHASSAVWRLPVDVLLYYGALPFADLTPSHRYTIRAQAAEDAVTVTLALMWPGNVTSDATATATGIVSGMLHQAGEPSVERED